MHRTAIAAPMDVSARVVGIVVVLLALGVPTQAGAAVLKLSLASFEVGSEDARLPDGGRMGATFGGVGLPEVGLGMRVIDGFGFALAVSGGHYFGGPLGGAPSLGLYLFKAAPFHWQKWNPVVYARVRGYTLKPALRDTFGWQASVGLGASRLFLNPELEVGYAWEQTGQGSGSEVVTSWHTLIRLGLGGWFEFLGRSAAD